MYNVLDVSAYVVNYSNKKEYSISNLRLQKLLYFIQAFYLIKENKPCFKEKIFAWELGPVVPEVYHVYKQYGSRHIPPVKTYFKIKDDSLWKTERIRYDDEKISVEDKKMINSVVDKFSEYSSYDLVELTHDQDPWNNAYHGSNNDKEITIQSIKEYFNG